MAKEKLVYVCEQCGQDSPKWVGKCPSCGAWNSFKQLHVSPSSASNAAPAGISLPGEFVFEVSFKEHRDAVRRSFFPGFRLAEDRTIVMETRDFMDVLRAVQFVL